ncbi:RNA 2',3'-cyclic phosphodiesterase [soil metagenome]
MSSGATLEVGERPRLFLALLLPDEVVSELAAWGDEHLVRGRRLEHFHVTLAFLGAQPRSELDAILAAMRTAGASTDPFTLEPVRYRETRSVGMLVLDDPTGEATRLAERLQTSLEKLGCYRREARPWLPHVTVLRFRERPRLMPTLPELGPFAPSEAAAFLSRLHRHDSAGGATYEILEKCPLNNSAGRMTT